MLRGYRRISLEHWRYYNNCLLSSTVSFTNNISITSVINQRAVASHCRFTSIVGNTVHIMPHSKRHFVAFANQEPQTFALESLQFNQSNHLPLPHEPHSRNKQREHQSSSEYKEEMSKSHVTESIEWEEQQEESVDTPKTERQNLSKQHSSSSSSYCYEESKNVSKTTNFNVESVNNDYNSELDKKELYNQVATRLVLPIHSTKYVLEQVKHGATVPFLARYRQDESGQLNEVEIRNIIDTAEEVREVHRRRQFMLKSLQQRELLTPELSSRLHRLLHLSQLEDFWEVYKERKTSLATRGREAGLAPLVSEFMNNSHNTILRNMRETISHVDDGEKLFMAIVLEEVQRCEHVREVMLFYMAQTARIGSAIVESARKKEAKEMESSEFAKLQRHFNFYNNKSWPVKFVNSHIVLALLRGEKKGVLKVNLETGPKTYELFLQEVKKEFTGFANRMELYQQYLRENNSNNNTTNDKTKRETRASVFYERNLLNQCLKHTHEYLHKSICATIKRDLRKSAEAEAIAVFARNLRHMLLQCPLTQARLLAIDPGLTNGVKCVALDEHGALLAHFIWNLMDETKMRNELKSVLLTHKLNKVVIGNGTASQRTTELVADVIKCAELHHVEFAVVSEAGASVYSVSEIAKSEFPTLDVMFRGAVSIGRRVLDPLSELVKIPVRSMGIGMYQHDVNERELTKALGREVESCVTEVGVNALSANRYVMEKVPGVNGKLVDQIVLARHAKKLESREDLRRVPGMTEAVFMQVAGFFRFPNSTEVLDNSRIHPESYDVVKRLIALYYDKELEEFTTSSLSSLSSSTEEVVATSSNPVKSNDNNVNSSCAPMTSKSPLVELSSNESHKSTPYSKETNQVKFNNAVRVKLGQLLSHFTSEQLAQVAKTKLQCGVRTLELICKELSHPGLDPRSSLPHAGLMRRAIRNVKELKNGDVLSGVVQSVTPFGAFVDCGLHHAVLLHGADAAKMQVGMHLAQITFKHLDELGRPQVSYTFNNASTLDTSTQSNNRVSSISHNNNSSKDNNNPCKSFSHNRLTNLPEQSSSKHMNTNSFYGNRNNDGIDTEKQTAFLKSQKNNLRLEALDVLADATVNYHRSTPHDAQQEQSIIHSTTKDNNVNTENKVHAEMSLHKRERSSSNKPQSEENERKAIKHETSASDTATITNNITTSAMVNSSIASNAHDQGCDNMLNVLSEINKARELLNVTMANKKVMEKLKNKKKKEKEAAKRDKGRKNAKMERTSSRSTSSSSSTASDATEKNKSARKGKQSRRRSAQKNKTNEQQQEEEEEYEDTIKSGGRKGKARNTKYVNDDENTAAVNIDSCNEAEDSDNEEDSTFSLKKKASSRSNSNAITSSTTTRVKRKYTRRQTKESDNQVAIKKKRNVKSSKVFEKGSNNDITNIENNTNALYSSNHDSTSDTVKFDESKHTPVKENNINIVDSAGKDEVDEDEIISL